MVYFNFLRSALAGRIKAELWVFHYINRAFAIHF